MDALSPNQVNALAEHFVRQASGSGHVVVIYQFGDHVSIRDNSGLTGLCSDALMDAVEKVLYQLFPEIQR